MAALCGVDVAAGPGMLEFERCFCFEKLLLDDEACGYALRIADGLSAGADLEEGSVRAIFDAAELGHYLSLRHTRDWLRRERYLPGPLMDLSPAEPWGRREGIALRAASEAAMRAISEGRELPPPDALRDLERAMLEIARPHGLSELPI